jgi:hypothetical protein
MEKCRYVMDNFPCYGKRKAGEDAPALAKMLPALIKIGN